MTGFGWNNVTRFARTRAVFAAVIANFVALPAGAQTTILQSNVGTGCSSVCINGNCTSTCNGTVTTTSNATQGNGDVQEKEFDLKGFKSLLVSDLNTTVQQGEVLSVKVVADSNLLDKVVVKLENNRLVARLENGHYTDATFSLEVVMPDLLQIEQVGANTLTFSGFDQSEMEILMNGSGTMIGNNNIVSKLNLNVSGAGKADLLGTELTRAAITIGGTGNVRLNFAESSRAGTAEVSGSVNGVAAVGICGDPKNTVQINGIANFSAIDC